MESLAYNGVAPFVNNTNLIEIEYIARSKGSDKNLLKVMLMQ